MRSQLQSFHNIDVAWRVLDLYEKSSSQILLRANEKKKEDMVTCAALALLMLLYLSNYLIKPDRNFYSGIVHFEELKKKKNESPVQKNVNYICQKNYLRIYLYW